MKTSPAFQFYAHDFLAGRVATYSLEEIGAYSMLLAFDWTLTGLPVEPEKLARLLRVSRRKFDRIWGCIGEQFPERDGRRYNPRLEIERAKQAEWREKSAKGGRANGMKGGSRVVEAKGQPNANTPTPSPSPTPVTASSSSAPTDEARLLDGLPDATVRLSWASELNAARQGMHGPALTDEQIAQACRDYVGNGHLGSPSLRHFRAFLRSAGLAVVRPSAPPPTDDGADAAWDAVLALLPAWQRREIDAAAHGALPVGTRRGLSKIGGFAVIQNTPTDKRVWLKRDFVAAYRAAPTQEKVPA